MSSLKDSCLICLASKENDFDNIFLINSNDYSNKSDLAAMYEDVFSLEINDNNNNNFPQYMCPYCVLQLKLSSKFKKKAVDSYTLIEKSNQIKKSIENINDINNDDDKITSDIIENNLSILDSINDDDDVEDDEEIITTTTSISPVPDTLIADTDENEDNMEVVIQEIDYEDFNTDNIKSNNNDDEFFEVQFLENESIKDNDDIAIESELNNDVDDEIYDDITVLSNISQSYIDEEIYEEYTVDSLNSDIIKSSNQKHKKLPNNNMKNVKNNKKYECIDCNLIFSQKVHLTEHKKEKHPPCICEICSKRFLSYDGYTSHMKVHMGLPGFVCDECGKTFNQKQHLTYHTQNYHSNVRNFQCDLCNKRFLTISDLKIHMRVHNDERRYECDVCNKRFRANTHMTNHRYTHFEKCIVCPHCHLKYASPSTLKTHIRSVHEGLCPYECIVCQKKFKRKHHLNSHLKTHKKASPEILNSRRKSLTENNEDIIIDGYVELAELEIKKNCVIIDDSDNLYIEETTII